MGLMIAFMQRVVLSITIVAMVTKTVTGNASEESDTCPVSDADHINNSNVVSID